MAGKGTLQCEICFENYDDLIRIPKFLQCYHTYCLLCLKTVLLNGNIKCPTCQKNTKITEVAKVDELQTNFYLTTQGGKKTDADSQNNAHGGAVVVKEKRAIDEMLCRNESKLKAGLAARREMAHKLDAILESFQTFFQELHELKKKNWQKKKHLERSIEELKNKAGTERVSGKTGPMDKSVSKEKNSANQTFQSLSVTLEKLLGECEEAVLSHTLLESINGFPFPPLPEVAADSGKADVLAHIFQQPLELGFKPELADSRQRQSVTALTYLVLINTDFGKSWRENLLMGIALKNVNTAETAEKSKKTVAESINKSVAVQKLDENRNVATLKSNDFSSLFSQTGKSAANQLSANSSPVCDVKNQKSASSQPIRLGESNKKNEQLINKLPNRAPIPLPTKPKCFLGIQVNGKPFGRVTIELLPDLAPTMSRRFLRLCDNANEVTYGNSSIHKAGAYIIGGRGPAKDDVFDADPSPLKRCRGAVFFRLKCDISKTRRSVVGSEFIIQLNDEKKDSTWTSTVFGYVCSGLQVCDRISRIDCSKTCVIIGSTGIVD